MSERNLSRKSTMIMFRIFLNLLQVEPRNSIRELKQLREASRDKNLKLKLNWDAPSFVSWVTSTQVKLWFWISSEELRYKQAKLVESLSKLVPLISQNLTSWTTWKEWKVKLISIFCSLGSLSLTHQVTSHLPTWDQEDHLCVITLYWLSISCMDLRIRRLSQFSCCSREALLSLWL